MLRTVGFVGLGVMGGPMSGHLVDAGHSVVIWNRTAEKAAPYAAKGAKVASNLSELAAQCDLIFLCVSRSEDVTSCLDTMMPTAKPGTLFVDHSTISPDAALELFKTTFFLFLQIERFQVDFISPPLN